MPSASAATPRRPRSGSGCGRLRPADPRGAGCAQGPRQRVGPAHWLRIVFILSVLECRTVPAVEGRDPPLHTLAQTPDAALKPRHPVAVSDSGR
nr:hypothetical protein GCM10020063_003710 [Dactylosporangium thailandense]